MGKRDVRKGEVGRVIMIAEEKKKSYVFIFYWITFSRVEGLMLWF